MSKLSMPELALRIGYSVGGARDITPCPVCAAKTRHTKSNDVRGAIGITPDGRGWHCFQCEKGGRVEDFLQYAHMRDPSNVPADMAIVNQLPVSSAAKVYNMQKYPYPNMNIVNQFWSRCNEPSGPQIDYLSKRFQKDLTGVSLYPYCRELIVRATDPMWMKQWAESGHNLVFSLYDAYGQRRSVLGRKTTAGSPKSKAPPRMARAGLSLLCVRKKSPMGIIVEGELDWLSWALFAPQRPSVVGVFAGSWRMELTRQFPHIHQWYVATDWDKQGDKYAADIQASFESEGRSCERLQKEQLTLFKEEV